MMLSVLIAFLVLANDPALPSARHSPLQAGAFAIDITPRLPISLNGGMTDRKAALVHDRLHARCLVLANDRTKLAIVVVDSCMVPDDVVATAKLLIQAKTGILPDWTVISATHTHTAPTLAPSFQSNPDPTYLRELPKTIADGVRLASERLTEAEMAWGQADVPDQVFNRRWFKKPGTVPSNPFGQSTDRVQMNPGVADPNLLEPAGPTDPRVAAIYFRTPKNRPIALLANYSLHYVGDVQGDAVSADYFGAFAAKTASLFGGDTAGPAFVAIMSNGTSGNINNIDFRKARPKLPMFGRTQLVADRVAVATHAAFSNSEFTQAAELRSAVSDLSLGSRKPNAEEIARAERILAAAKGRPLRGLEEFYANETLDVAKYPEAKTIRIQAMRIGSVGIVAIPCEVFVEIGLTIQRESPIKNTFVISLANGYSGYLPTAEHHRLGGYETWRAKSSFLEVDAAWKIQKTALQLLRQVAQP